MALKAWLVLLCLLALYWAVYGYWLWQKRTNKCQGAPYSFVLWTAALAILLSVWCVWDGIDPRSCNEILGMSGAICVIWAIVVAPIMAGK